MSKIITLIVAAGLTAPAFAQSPSQQADAFYKQGQAAEKAGDPSAAKGFYASALKANPAHADARFSIGQLKLTSGNIAAQGREAKFGSVMIPAYQLDGASLQEALDALDAIILKESKEAVTPNFIIQDPQGQLATQKISLNLKNMPSKAVMKYLMDMSGAKARYDEHAVVVSPK